jgi:hypothetical protein
MEGQLVEGLGGGLIGVGFACKQVVQAQRGGIDGLGRTQVDSVGATISEE